MSAFSSLMDSLDRQPRAMRWAVATALGLVLFFLWNEVVFPKTQEWATQAAAIEDRLAVIQASEMLDFQGRSMREVVSGIGEVDLPTTEAEAKQSLREAINEVLKDYAVTKDQIIIRNGSKLRGRPLPTIARGKQVKRLDGVLQFIADDNLVLPFIAALEAHPAIEAVNEVRLGKTGNGRKMQVKLSLEAWYLDTPRRRKN